MLSELSELNRHYELTEKLNAILAMLKCDRSTCDLESRLARLEREVARLRAQRDPSKGRECE